MSYAKAKVEGLQFLPAGGSVSPKPTVKYYRYDPSSKTTKEYDLVEGTDYVITGYTDNTAPGTGKVILQGINDYYGKKEVEFEIVDADKGSISNAVITLGSNSVVYDGKEHKPTVTVTYGSKTLNNGIDYSVQYSTNDFTNAGNKTITVTGRRNFSGSQEIVYRISPRDVNSSGINVIRPNKTSYRDSDIIVTYNGKTLRYGTDYYAEFSDATGKLMIGHVLDEFGKTEAKNNVNVVIYGDGNFTGTKKILDRADIAWASVAKCEPEVRELFLRET